MTPLGQTELLEAPPTRRLIVPPGHGAIYGVDPGTQRLAIAVVTASGERRERMISFARLQHAQRLASIFSAASRLASELAEQAAPGLVVVERPSGQHQNLPLLYAVGATTAGLYEGIVRVTGAPPHFDEVAPAQWKKVACGYGAIYKPKPPCEPEDYAVLRWAKTVGYEGTSFDVADSIGISEYARKTFELIER